MNPDTLTGSFVLPPDVVITPVRRLPARVRHALPTPSGYAITRVRHRRATKLVDSEGAGLLRAFRRPRRIVDVVGAAARRRGDGPEQLLREAFPLLRDCINDRLLVAAGAPDARALVPLLADGASIGRYRVVRCVRLLADSELYQVKDRGGRLAALKLTMEEGGASLVRERAVLEHLDGPPSVKLLDGGVWQDRSWLALEWRAGISPIHRATELRAAGDVAGVLRLCSAIASAYSALHQRGVVHADVHPGNVLVDAADTPVILDFGQAQLAGSASARAAARGAVAWYLAPEHARRALEGRRWIATRRSDQYGVAAMLYHMMSGRTYVDFDLGRRAMLEQIVQAAPRPLARRGAPELAGAERVLRRALAKNPARRWPSMAQLAAALHEAARAPGRTARPVPRPGPADGADILRRFREQSRLYDNPLTDRASCSLALGAAGTAYVFYRLALVRGDREALATGCAWIDKVEPEAAPGGAFLVDANAASFGETSPFHTASGAHAVRALIAQAQGSFKEAGRAVGCFVLASRGRDPRSDLYTGRAGTLVGVAALLEALHAPALLQARRSLIALGNAALKDLRPAIEQRGASGRDAGIAHGVGGMLFAALRYSRASGAPLPFDTGRTFERITRAAGSAGRGLYWPSAVILADGATGPGYAAGWCNGAAGMLHLFLLGHDMLHHPPLLARAEQIAWSVWENGRTEADLCCGDAGRAWALLAFYRHTGETAWLERARVLAARSLATWRRRQTGRYPLSLFKGGLGPALLAAEIEIPERSCMPFFESEGWPRGGR